MSSERAEGALRTDTQNALRALAEETSGALIANTNDLGPGLIDRVRADLDSYYEIGYMPGSGAADGRFRPVEVKLARKGVSVHSRSGYFALPETDTTPLLPFELPMLSAAAATPPPQAFEYSAAAFRFDRCYKRRAAHGRRRGATRTSDLRGKPSLANLWAAVHGDDAGEGSERTDRPAVERDLPAGGAARSSRRAQARATSLQAPALAAARALHALDDRARSSN